MDKTTHDPSEYIRGLQQLLVSDKKRIAFLFGAGTSQAKKDQNAISIPAMRQMTELIGANLNKDDKYRTALQEIKEEIGDDKYNIETLLSNLEQKKQIICNGELNGLNKDEIKDLIIEIKHNIKKLVGIQDEIIKEGNLGCLVQSDFAEWIGRANRKYPVEIFTTNYDYLFELGLEYKNIPYYDGFTGSFRPFFNSLSVDDLDFLPQQTKLWKIHGSLGWHLSEDHNIIWRKDLGENNILIYPSTLKYTDSKKQPYLALMDRLTSYLKQPDTILITCGYSFGDEHINERILTALQSNTTAHVFALLYDVFWENGEKQYAIDKDAGITKLAKTNSKISVFACRGAIIGCQYGKWKLKREPDKNSTIGVNLYFDEDGPMYNDIKSGKECFGEEKWTGEGELVLPDFVRFIEFLQSMIIRNEWIGGEK